MLPAPNGDYDRAAQGERALLRRFSNWFLVIAVILLLVLFVGLGHDFAQAKPDSGWFSGRPTIPLVLLVLGYLCMLGHRYGSRDEE